jgi:hypothetical protein
VALGLSWELASELE